MHLHFRMAVPALPDLSHTLLQDNNGMIIGAEVKDNLSGKKTSVYAKQVINATGPFTDGLRQMSDPTKPSIIMPSAGIPLPPHLSTSNNVTSVPIFTNVIQDIHQHMRAVCTRLKPRQTVFETNNNM